MASINDLPYELLYQISKSCPDVNTYHNYILAVPNAGEISSSPDLNLHLSSNFIGHQVSNEYMHNSILTEHKLNGHYHNINDQPAYVNGRTKKWYQYGKLHRNNDNPAIIIYGCSMHRDKYTRKRFYHHGILHRIDGPAYINRSEWDASLLEKRWYHYGILHRTDGPAVQKWYSGRKLNEELWYYKGKLHNISSPALIIWDRKGNKMTEEWYYEGELHRKDGPAVTFWYDGNKIIEKWCYKGSIHRNNAPAYITWDETGMINHKEYYHYGKRVYNKRPRLRGKKRSKYR